MTPFSTTLHRLKRPGGGKDHKKVLDNVWIVVIFLVSQKKLKPSIQHSFSFLSIEYVLDVALLLARVLRQHKTFAPLAALLCLFCVTGGDDERPREVRLDKEK